MRRLRAWLVSLYPASWRARYGAEFEALLEECLRSPLDVLDIALGALDAHLALGPVGDWRLMNMNNKRRTAILVVFAAYIASVVAGMSLYGLADDNPMAALMKTGRDLPLLLSWLTVQAAALVAFASVVIGGLPLAWIVVRRALRSPREDLRLLLVPVVSFLALVGYAALVVAIGLELIRIPGVQPAITHDAFPLGNRLLIGGGMLVFVLGALASTLAVWRLILRIDPASASLELPVRSRSLDPYQTASIGARVTSAAMLLMLAATVAWGLFSYKAMPDVFVQDWGLLETNTALSLSITISLMALATGAALLGLKRARNAM